tara:strand:- start:56 stop:235 length:180 start_codon:yes stop_codon:yes gene_type:complete
MENTEWEQTVTDWLEWAAAEETAGNHSRANVYFDMAEAAEFFLRNPDAKFREMKTAVSI